MYDIDVPYTEDFKELLTAYCIIYDQNDTAVLQKMWVNINLMCFK